MIAHHHLGEFASGARTSAGTLRGESRARRQPVTGRFQKIRTTGYAGFEECLVKMLSFAAGTGAREAHSCMWRSSLHPIHVARSSFMICVTAKRPIGSDRGAGVITNDPKENTHERYESSGPCRSRRIAHAGRSGRARPGDVVEQSRRRRGGPGRFEANDHGSWLAPRTPRGSSSSPPSLVSATFSA